ncbi:hypothetical protein [Synechococcus sp. TAK9802]|uniref:hypothetical protein n=1 Tax=Synechococcus sp. TAK9802 TaxID=1442558 RepID=UPI001646D8B5|nr:hypothetical protein [Synechococcus sp. TAK9802]
MRSTGSDLLRRRLSVHRKNQSMKDRVILYLAGFSAATIAGLGVMLHQAMNVEATTRNDVNTATTHFTCSIVEDFTNKGEVKSCCWDGMCARFPVRPF